MAQYYATKLTKYEIHAALLARDGDTCMYPGCKRLLDFSAVGRREVTIDHIYPVSKAKADGWTFDEIWDISNLQLLEKCCNAAKGDKLYREDGTLPAPKQRKILRKEKRAGRPTLTDCCYSGRLLLPGETCDECGHSFPQNTFPAEYVVKSQECPHSGPWSCWSCYIGHTPREPASKYVGDMEILDDQ